MTYDIFKLNLVFTLALPSGLLHCIVSPLFAASSMI